MADAESLIEGKGTVKKNLQFFIIGIVGIVIVAAIFLQDASSKKRKEEQQQATDQEETPKPIVEADIKAALDAQKSTNINNSAQLAGIPSSVTEGVGRTEEETLALNKREAELVENAKQQAQLNGSSILAIGTEGEGLTSVGESLQNQQLRQALSNEDLDIDEDELRKALAPPTLDTELLPQPATTREEQDLAWLKAQGKRTETKPITEDIANAPYTIFQGSVIPAVLMTKISSQLPGNVTGIVTQDVYDDVTGQHIVVPKGSTVYGAYNNTINEGQSRLLIAFTRLKLPNGRTVSLEGMPGTDKVGQQGVEGEVNNRYFKRYSFSFLTALLGGIADNNNTGNTTIINTGSSGGAVSTAAGTILTEISRNEQQRSLQIRPIIEINQGTKFNISVNRDVSIGPY